MKTTWRCGHARTPENTSGIAKTRPNGQCRFCHRAALSRYLSSPGAPAQLAAAQKRHYDKTKRQRRTGWSQDAYQTAYRLQDGRCAICEKPFEALVGDHCHETNQPRALLCWKCNWVLGHADDDATTLRAAAAYLDRFDRQAA